ncbi:Molybdopterin dehydrogenase, FAD-binding:CO dehydrogenase [Pseudomonas cannabina pv. alisalensis]|uniref:Molybdopterin dehydrogenase, FAD-binding:CO dehydrogenase n=2 Tax=Pseudomonas cannabina TaxID=86840 RepID=A0A3M3S4K2_PSECA|nr:xanthine dehydrogenase family protein subunit M [Pseudomonas cannabina]KPW19682.1 Molybdopterin dehydrogenase, FAD-binding:CO dehydrogenase [Pseudomonas cannabina pv. alisalensis]MBM0140632.1 xanthine dehydrogenase family protein subunit M [Pseudomonas cannabina pv. alisalensis]RMN76148.1 Molybdopterin dehydrogenase, FAD-binding:CO dehydrogenase [Pseudomonas cannabina]RMN80144.1 Molybdopterin dehydrogenase, FAD-binding:CO dehydrogenase [Pseudomonas cannabina pv. alisalensis]RMO03415.1 Molyb
MNPFTYSKPTDVSAAVNLSGPATRFIAGGTNLLDLMKENVARPEYLIDITGLPLRDVSKPASGGLMIGALVSNADLAYHPLIEQNYPLLSKAVLAGASPQLRNMASTGGNLLQRTRCYYFYDTGVPCNKREPGTGCPAREGLNRIHAILGASDDCVATHPSDMCVALAALEAVVHVEGRAGKRTIEFADFHRLPGDAPERDNQLADDELITAVELPAARFASNSAYLKVRDRQSYAFALVSVAAALDLDNGVIRDVRLALGGVAHKPWRDKAVESLLIGKPVTRENFAAVADAMLEDAQPLAHNGFKVRLARRAIIRALSDAATGGSAQ